MSEPRCKNCGQPKLSHGVKNGKADRCAVFVDGKLQGYRDTTYLPIEDHSNG